MEKNKKIPLPFIFLLGRPGCGKSLIYKILSEKFQKEKIASQFIRIDDFPILQALLKKDIKFKRHIEKDGGFAVTDWSIIDAVLQIINKTAFNKVKKNKIIFIEFSRASYIKALNNFSPLFLNNSVILYIKTSFKICLKRNEERFKKNQTKNVDDHIVPPDLMKSYYKDDDFEKIIDSVGEQGIKLKLSSPFFIINNNEGIKSLNQNLIKFINFYKNLL